jgi:uncharacterized protein
MRIVLDTNIFVSALISSTGPPAQLLVSWRNGDYDLWLHDILLDEIRDVTRRPILRPLIDRNQAGLIVNRLHKAANFATKLPPVYRSPDPKDDFLLALSEAAAADYLVTGDKADLLSLKRHGATQIVTARMMLNILNPLN